MNLLTFAVYPIGGFFLAYLAVVVHWVLVLLIFPWVCLMGFLTTRIRCPNCNVPVGWHKYRFLAFRYDYWSPLTPRRCEWCGSDLTGREAGKD
jgi:hypothetical protein